MAKTNKRAAQKSGGSKSFTWILGVVGVVGILAAVYSLSSRALSGTATAPVEVEGLDDPATLNAMARGVLKGDPEAPITIYEFADFQCPACGQFWSLVRPQMEAAFVESGQAKVLFYDFPLTSLHPNAFLASRAARCAEDQGKFWEYHDELFRNQGVWSGSGAPTGMLVGYAEAIGLDKGTFSSCVKSDRHADLVTAQMRLGEALGVSGTPTVMVSRGQGMATRISSNDFASIQRAVEELIDP